MPLRRFGRRAARALVRPDPDRPARGDVRCTVRDSMRCAVAAVGPLLISAPPRLSGAAGVRRVGRRPRRGEGWSSTAHHGTSLAPWLRSHSRELPRAGLDRDRRAPCLCGCTDAGAACAARGPEHVSRRLRKSGTPSRGSSATNHSPVECLSAGPTNARASSNGRTPGTPLLSRRYRSTRSCRQ